MCCCISSKLCSVAVVRKGSRSNIEMDGKGALRDLSLNNCCEVFCKLYYITNVIVL